MLSGILSNDHDYVWNTSFNEFHYNCLECKISCCRIYSVGVSDSDVELMKKHRGDKVSDCVEGSPGNYHMKKTGDGYCVLVKDGLCSIQEYKPYRCRTYPLILDVASDGSIRLDRVRLCREASAGVKVDREYVSDHISRSVNRYPSYYSRQSSQYAEKTSLLSHKQPLLSDLSRIERLSSICVKEALEKDFDPSLLYKYFITVSRMNTNQLQLLEAGKKITDLSNVGGDSRWDPMDYVGPLLNTSKNYIRFSEDGFARRDYIRLQDGFIVLEDRDTSDMKKIDVKHIPSVMSVDDGGMLADYVLELALRAKTSQYMLARAGEDVNIFEAIGYLLYYYLCGLLLCMHTWTEDTKADLSRRAVEDSIACFEYGLKGGIDELLTP